MRAGSLKCRATLSVTRRRKEPPPKDRLRPGPTFTDTPLIGGFAQLYIKLRPLKLLPPLLYKANNPSRDEPVQQHFISTFRISAPETSTTQGKRCHYFMTAIETFIDFNQFDPFDD